MKKMKLGMSAFKGLILGAAVCGVTMGSALAKVSSTTKNAIQERINSMLQVPTPVEVSETPIAGLYQVTLGVKVVYMSGDGKLLLNGALIDVTTDTNLTEEVETKARLAALKAIPEEGMIIYPGKKATGGANGRTITVFTDIDCPYCEKLHKEVPALNEAGITVRYLSYPRAGMNSPSYHKAVSVWCADDQLKTMDKAMAKGAVAPKQCQNPVADHMQLARKFGVNGTPNIVLDTGELLPGYVPAVKLINFFNGKQS